MFNVYCIIVTYNGCKWIRNCLSSIAEPNLNLSIVVIDNNSSDNTTQIIKQEFPHVILKENKVNLGFGGANNLGYEIAKENGADYIYLLNQDTISYSNCIEKLIQVSQKIKNIGVVSPMHLNETGEALDSDFEGYITSKTCKNYISDASLGKLKEHYELGFINAAAWLVAVETIEYMGGLFSSAFYHYGEDVNFIGRLRKFGFRNLIVTKCFVHHCREERIDGLSKEYQNKVVQINKVTMMHDIKRSYKDCYIDVLKYGLQQFFKGNYKNFFELVFYPLLNYKSISKYRNAYLKRDLQVVP